MKIVKIGIGLSALAFLLLSISVLHASLPPVKSEGGNPDLYSYFATTVPTIDGVFGSGEWQAPWQTITMDGLSFDLRIINDDRFLYMAFSTPDTTLNDNDGLWLYFDEDEMFPEPSYRNHDHLLTGYSEDMKHSRADGYFADNYYPPPPGGWLLDSGLPGGTDDGETAWGFITPDPGPGHWLIEVKLPLKSSDRLDLNARSGVILGLHIHYFDHSIATSYFWPSGSINIDATTWGNLWTSKTYGASVPHAHDVPGQWVAYLGLMNTGTSASTVVFSFYDDLGNLLGVTTIPLNPNAHYGNWVRVILGAPSFVGSIYITSNQPFCGQLNQHDAAMTQFAMYPFIGTN